MPTQKPATIDEYIESFPKEVQAILQQIRKTVKQAAPGAEEKISYGMPTFTLDGHHLVYFAGYRKHIGLYPVPTGAKEFEKEFSKYKTSGKGSIQFPLDEPMPLGLIARIVKYRIQGVKKNKYTHLLQGSDLRSIGKANQVVTRVKGQKDFDELFSLLSHPDRKVAMRAADAVEKITKTKASFLKKHKVTLLRLLDKASHIELKWHLALLLPRLQLNPSEVRAVWKQLVAWATDKTESKIVRVNSIEALHSFALNDKKRRADLEQVLNEIVKENIPSLSARIRKLRPDPSAYIK